MCRNTAPLFNFCAYHGVDDMHPRVKQGFSSKKGCTTTYSESQRKAARSVDVFRRRFLTMGVHDVNSNFCPEMRSEIYNGEPDEA